jgi:hypothetical protein
MQKPELLGSDRVLWNCRLLWSTSRTRNRSAPLIGGCGANRFDTVAEQSHVHVAVGTSAGTNQVMPELAGRVTVSYHDGLLGRMRSRAAGEPGPAYRRSCWCRA